MTILIVCYLLIASLFLRPLAGHFAWVFCNSWKQDKPDQFDWCSGTFVGALFSSVWPILLVVVFLSKLSTKIFPAIGAEKQAQLKIEIEARKQRDEAMGLEPYEYGRIQS